MFGIQKYEVPVELDNTAPKSNDIEFEIPEDEKVEDLRPIEIKNLQKTMVQKYEVPVEYHDSESLEHKSEFNKIKLHPKNKMKTIDYSNESNGNSDNNMESFETNIIKCTMANSVLYHFCKICNLKCSSKRIVETHMEVHDTKRKFKCNVCGYRFTGKVNLDQHMVKHSEAKFFCNACEFKTKWRTKLNAHMKRKHTEIVEGDFPLEDNELEASDDASRSYGSPYINVEVEIIEGIETEEITQDSNTDHVSKKQKIEENQGNDDCHSNVNSTEDLYIFCRLCQIKCSNKRVLETHMKVHDLSRMFECPVCGYRFTGKVNLDQHMVKHSDVKYDCDICNYTTKWKNHLNAHIKRRHQDGSKDQTSETAHVDSDADEPYTNSNNKNSLFYKCNFCDYKCYNEQTMDKHMKLHDSSRKFECTVCSYRFTGKFALEKHMLKHADKKFSCIICGRKYTYDCDLTRHMAVHDGKVYCCDVCGRKLYSASALAKHESDYHKHNYKCKVCSKTIKKNSEFNRHMEKHMKTINK